MNPRHSLDFYPHRHVVVTRRSDSIGGHGHVPNAVLADYADDARERMHLAIMGPGLFTDTASLSLVLAETASRYLHEITHPSTIEIGVALAAIGTSSLTQVSGVFQDGRCMILSRAIMVRVIDRRPARFTAEERHRAEAFMARGATDGTVAG